MLMFSKYPRWIWHSATFGLASIIVVSIGVGMARSQVSLPPVLLSPAQAVTLIVRTDRTSYKPGDYVNVSAALQNNTDKTLYVDRRMFWTGYGGGLKLEIRDEEGKALPAHLLSDAIMPPPKPGDLSILVPVDQAFFYGTSATFPVKDFFPKAGKYSIRVAYKSWLRKQFVAPQLRDLPALWEDTPAIVSSPVWIEITQ